VSNDVVILPATVEDAGELLTLQRAAYVTEGQLHDTPFLPPLTETLEEMMSVLSSKPVFKAVSGTRIVGAIRMTVHDTVGEIGRIAVAPDQQGRGIGTQLLRHAERLAPGQVIRFELFTGPNSAPNSLPMSASATSATNRQPEPKTTRSSTSPSLARQTDRAG
jgi:ribosomal protein S18 acetylase RimI-like enzyme